MTLTIEIQTHTNAATRFWLRCGQKATVGRSIDADYCVPSDQELEPIHFSLECDRNEARVRVTATSSSLRVNKQPATQAILAVGDSIEAGSTAFVVREVPQAAPVARPQTPRELPSSAQSEPSASSRSTSRTPLATPRAPRNDQQEETVRVRKPPQAISLAPVHARKDGTSGTDAENRSIVFRQKVKPRPIVRLDLVIQRIGGPKKTVHLRPGQTLVVGRSELADIALPEDSQLSSRHCVIECTYSAAYVRDQQSTNGTWVNGVRVRQAILRHGDQLRVGASIVSLSIDKDQSLKESYFVEFAAQKSRSRSTGLWQYQGTFAESDPAALIGSIAEAIPLCMIFDAHRLQIEKNELPSSAQYLFDWIAPSVVDRLSPSVWWVDDHQLRDYLIEKAWGRDGLLCLFSHREPSLILQRLRDVARGRDGRIVIPDESRIWGACHPRKLLSQFTTASYQYAHHLFDVVDAMLLESKTPTRWHLLAGDDLDRELVSAGFRLTT